METIDKASNYAHEAVDMIANASNQAAETLDQKGEQLKTAEQRIVKNCQVYIRDNPVTALGIAVAGGFLLSRLLSSR
ncbi:DUF883 family protein [Methylomonas sp. MED-D]|uniref:DUF883 domain-containing protein n=1 Tax=Methylomonas koyamae TaxID=702114 RepID=A0A177N6L6_9GAMM|nr:MULTISPECIES: DUF883 family protein [Methylomonas]NJA06281.1 DUF883 family protein [Methylococcaceae bacterium WWC4]MDT4328459.1 DUF883 family protein [Methylomonas sp. MV1]OAI13502.1 hypothetical protein A1355_13430 [Methylomonas koyamae]OHX36607.1 DUF883 domain-containing protein [Methylomonas sp. LWB]WGS88241.1 DUF883 family protein [Methylomonas sp. UP202]